MNQTCNYQQESEDRQYLYPRFVHQTLSKKIIGQEKAKKRLSILLYQHQLRYQAVLEGKSAPRKMNGFLIGHTGAGKTLIADTLADFIDFPFVKIDATTLVQNGYRGGILLEDILLLLSKDAINKAYPLEWGIVFIDEIDKLQYTGREGDVATSGVQRQLLALVDGKNFNSCESEYDTVAYNTENILFIFSGSFPSIKIDQLDMLDGICSRLVSFGIIPELVGRMGVPIVLEKPDESVIRRIIWKAIDEYSSCGAFYKKERLHISANEKEALTEIIKLQLEKSSLVNVLGVRGIYQIVWEYFAERLYDCGPSSEVEAIRNMLDGTIMLEEEGEIKW